MLLVAVWLSGCKKQAEISPPQDLLLHKAELFFKIKQEENLQVFLQNQTIQREQTSLFNTLAYRTFLPDWAKSKIIHRNNGSVVILTPVSRSVCTRYANDLYYIRRLRTEFDANNNILSSSIVELLTLDENTAQKQNTILKELQNYPQNDFSGYVYQYDLAYNLLQEYQGANNTSNSEMPGLPPPTCFEPHYMDICGVLTITYIPIACRSNSIIGGSSQKITVIPCTGGDTGGVSAGGGGSSGGTNPTTPSPPSPNPGLCNDLGQDVPFNPDAFDYNGVNINQFYKDKNGVIQAAGETNINIVKILIDDPDFREIIASYLGNNNPKITISWDRPPLDLVPNIFDNYYGSFDKRTNTIYLNPNLHITEGNISLVITLIHEAMHAMYFRPNGNQEIELFTIKSWFDATTPPTPTNTNMIHHNGMATYHLDKAVNILRRFDKQSPGWNANNPNITDEHYKALFLVGLLYGPDPITGSYSKLEIKKWEALPKSTRDDYLKKLAPELIKTYKL